MMFFSEAHSSHPKSGDDAVVFPVRREDDWREAVYGASYWPTWSDAHPAAVRVDWRNAFLKEAFSIKMLLEDQFREIGTLELEKIVAAWGGDLCAPRAGTKGELAGDQPTDLSRECAGLRGADQNRGNLVVTSRRDPLIGAKAPFSAHRCLSSVPPTSATTPSTAAPR
ncbi:MAG: hypothetical protein GY906_16575 [bacterium]|nr:hypothetical protein [bacterium]